jgi:DNA-binding PadR family transcriptional regulator
MLEYAILAILRTGPAYGYGLRAELKLRGVRTWKITASHIYHLLHKLESRDLVRRVSSLSPTFEAPKERKTPEAHFYEITARGASYVDRWLSKTPRPQKAIRREIIVRLMQFDDDQLGAAILQLERELQVCRKTFAKLKREFDRAKRAGEFSGTLAMICEEAEIRQAGSHLDWVESVLRRLRETESADPNRPTSNLKPPENEARADELRVDSHLRAVLTGRA